MPKIYRTLLAVMACAGFATVAHAIDFTPRHAETVEEGFTFRRMYFTDTGVRIFFRPPADWQISGQSSAIGFFPKDPKYSRVRLEAAPAEHAALPFDEKGLQSLRGIAHSLTQEQFSQAVEQWESVNPVIIHGWTSFEVGFNYQSNGLQFCRSVLFINLSPDRQIRVVVDAPAANFQKLQKIAYRSLSTWWEVKDRKESSEISDSGSPDTN